MNGLPPADDDALLASWGGGEDAALWRIDERRLGILTVDFITPVVDDPARFGEIAAANALSDVFAMGGRPLIALNVVGFPTACAPIETLQDILAGGAAKVCEAGALLAGGHSVQDEEPKYGLAVFGEVAVGKEWRVRGAREGDALLLTKPLGTGIAVTAIKAGLFPEEATRTAIESMAALNDIRRADIPDALRANIHACTDVTGFGLAGHALDMLDDGLALTLYGDRLPLLPQVGGMAAMGMIPAGAYANREHTGDRVDCEASGERQHIADVLFDPQTSGGLLLAVARDAAEDLAIRLRGAFPHTTVIGAFTAGDRRIRVA